MDKDTEDAFKLLGKNMQTGFDNIQKSLESIKADMTTKQDLESIKADMTTKQDLESIKADMTTKQDLESIKADMDRRCSPAQTE